MTKPSSLIISTTTFIVTLTLSISAHVILSYHQLTSLRNFSKPSNILLTKQLLAYWIILAHIFCTPASVLSCSLHIQQRSMGCQEPEKLKSGNLLCLFFFF